MGNFNRILSTLILFLFQAYTLKFQNGTVTVKETRRSLPTAIDSAKSGFFGNGVGVGELYTPLVATVQAKDASGVNITTGGDLLAISITNECTITGYLECTPKTNATDMEISPDYFIMTDQGDGTYTADYSCGIEGTVTLIPYLFKQNQILVNFYPDKIFTPPAVHNETWPQVNQDYNTGVIFGTYTDSISASIYFVIKVPVTEEYTFTLESNDGSDLYMNSTIMISQLGVTCNCSSSFDVNLTQNTYVDFQINYIEIADEAHINLKWNSSTISTAQLIPNSVLYYKEYIGSPPYHTEIKCDKYYSSGNPDHPFECYEICGDGVRIGRELCDDKNEKSGDGCSKDCRTIEDRYVCRTYTDEKTPDRCIKCKSGYVRNSDETDCERASKRKMNESLGYLTYALVGVDLGLCLIVFLFTKQSLNAFTMTISYLQVVILMGMLNAEMPENFLGFITEISEMMLPLGFLSRESISGTYLGCKQFERELEICLLTQIMGLDDRSSWSILSYHTLLFVLLLLFHALLLCLYHRDQKLKKLEGEREHEHAIEKIFKYCTFKMYIPYFQLFFTVMMVSSFTEFTSCLYDDGVEGGSCFFASMIWLACSSVLVIVGWQYFKSQYNYSFSKMKYFKNLFSGLRLSWKSRSYSFLIFARIYAFVILCTIASIVDVKRYHVIRDVNFVMFLTILQMAYMIGTILSFPFKIYTYNIKLIVNEISIATLMVFATRSKEKGGLSDSAGSVLIHMIFFITCAASVFSVGAILVVIYQKIFKSLTKSRIESKSQFERYYEKSQEHSSYIAGSYLTNQPVEKNTEAKTKPKKKKLKKKKLHNKFEEEKVPRFDINEENDAVQF